MLIMYRGSELVPVMDGEKWLVRISSAGKRITTTTLLADEQSAMTKAKKIVDDIRSIRR